MWFRLLSITTGIVLAGLLSPAQVSADTTAPLLTPALVDKKVAEGEQINLEFTVVNPSETDLNLGVSAVVFTPAPDGSAVFQPGDDAEVLNWIEFPANQLLVETGQQNKMPVSIRIPQNTIPGSYNFAVVFSESVQTELEQSGSSAYGSMAALVFLTIPGNVGDQVAEITRFEPALTFGYLDARLFTEVTNLSRFNLVPVGVVNLTLDFGLDLNPPDRFNLNAERGRLLGETVRTYTTDWNNDGWFRFGMYTADVVMAYGDSNQVISSSIQFWVIPWKYIIGTMIIAMLLMLVRVWMRRKQVLLVRKRK